MTETQHRPVRSFVLRQGRMSKGQTRAHETLMPRFGVPFSEEKLDLPQLFGRTAPKILEIGFGMGDSTATIAHENPENDYLCIEVHTPGVGSLLKYTEEMGLTNIRIIQHDAVEVLQHMLSPETLDGVHIFFPDPWHKKRHHKRRLIQPAFTALICDPPEYVRNYTRQNDLPFTIALDADGKVAQAFNQVKLTPTTFIIGKDGHILQQTLGELDFVKLHALLEQQLGDAT